MSRGGITAELQPYYLASRRGDHRGPHHRGWTCLAAIFGIALADDKSTTHPYNGTTAYARYDTYKRCGGKELLKIDLRVAHVGGGLGHSAWGPG